MSLALSYSSSPFHSRSAQPWSAVPPGVRAELWLWFSTCQLCDLQHATYPSWFFPCKVKIIMPASWDHCKNKIGQCTKSTPWMVTWLLCDPPSGQGIWSKRGQVDHSHGQSFQWPHSVNWGMVGRTLISKVSPLSQSHPDILCPGYIPLTTTPNILLLIPLMVTH